MKDLLITDFLKFWLEVGFFLLSSSDEEEHRDNDERLVDGGTGDRGEARAPLPFDEAGLVYRKQRMRFLEVLLISIRRNQNPRNLSKYGIRKVLVLLDSDEEKNEFLGLVAECESKYYRCVSPFSNFGLLNEDLASIRGVRLFTKNVSLMREAKGTEWHDGFFRGTKSVVSLMKKFVPPKTIGKLNFELLVSACRNHETFRMGLETVFERIKLEKQIGQIVARVARERRKLAEKISEFVGSKLERTFESNSPKFTIDYIGEFPALNRNTVESYVPQSFRQTTNENLGFSPFGPERLLFFASKQSEQMHRKQGSPDNRPIAPKESSTTNSHSPLDLGPWYPVWSHPSRAEYGWLHSSGVEYGAKGHQSEHTEAIKDSGPSEDPVPERTTKDEPAPERALNEYIKLKYRSGLVYPGGEQRYNSRRNHGKHVEPSYFSNGGYYRMSNAMIATTEGGKRISELVGRSFVALVDGNLRPCEGGFFFAGEQKVFDITTSMGYRVRLTGRHQLMTQRKELTEVRKLYAGCVVMLHNHLAFTSRGRVDRGEGTFEDGLNASRALNAGSVYDLSSHERKSIAYQRGFLRDYVMKRLYSERKHPLGRWRYKMCMEEREEEARIVHGMLLRIGVTSRLFNKTPEKFFVEMSTCECSIFYTLTKITAMKRGVAAEVMSKNSDSKKVERESHREIASKNASVSLDYEFYTEKGDGKKGRGTASNEANESQHKEEEEEEEPRGSDDFRVIGNNKFFDFKVDLEEEAKREYSDIIVALGEVKPENTYGCFTMGQQHFYLDVRVFDGNGFYVREPLPEPFDGVGITFRNQ